MNIDFSLLFIGLGGAIVSLRLADNRESWYLVILTLIGGVVIAYAVTPAICETFTLRDSVCKAIAFGLGTSSRQILEFIDKIWLWLKTDVVEALKKLAGK